MREARESIYINMFIWRDDVIGNTIARELLEAADRGVKVEIVKDRYGILCEYSEEDQSSFFHKDPRLPEKAEKLSNAIDTAGKVCPVGTTTEGHTCQEFGDALLQAL